jgi:hypothetical protein
MPFELRCYYPVFVSPIFELSSFSSYQRMLNKCNQLLTRILWRVRTSSNHPMFWNSVLLVPTFSPPIWLKQCLPSALGEWVDDWARLLQLQLQTKRRNRQVQYGIVQFHCPLCCAAHSHKQKKAWSQYYMYVGTRVATCLISGLGPSIQHH